MAVIQNQGLEIFFEDSGAGPSVVLGHSRVTRAARHPSPLEQPAAVTAAILEVLAAMPTDWQSPDHAPQPTARAAAEPSRSASHA